MRRLTDIAMPSAPLARYAAAALGPVALAASQFVLLFQLLHSLDASDFGTFSFLLIATQLSLGVSNALLCGPLAVVVNDTPEDIRPATMRGLFAFNSIFCALSAAVIGFISLALGLSASLSVVFAAYAGVNALRWFGRAYIYASARWLETVLSDVLASIIVLIGIASFTLSGASLAQAGALLLTSALIGLAPFGGDFIRSHLAWPSPRVLSANYGGIWRRYSRWTLVGVLTTEATANSHAYIVTLLSGPNAFAVLAASAIIIRPITVMMNALSDFERPVMARHIGAGAMRQVQHDIVVFRLALLGTWLITACAAFALIYLMPRLLFPPKYGLHDLSIGVALWMAVAAVRILRMPESTVLQAAGQFRELAHSSIYSSILSVTLVAVIVALASPLLSIFGVLAGEIVFAVGIWRQFARMDKLQEQSGHHAREVIGRLLRYRPSIR